MARQVNRYLGGGWRLAAAGFQAVAQEVAPSGLGSAYHAIYAGINYLIYGDPLKLMTGAEYSVMKDAALGEDRFNGWTYLAGARVFSRPGHLAETK